MLADTNTQEDIASITRLLHHLIGEITLCDKIIAHQQLVFDHLSDCCSDLLETNPDEVLAIWDSILMHNKANVTWQNAMDYWNAFELTDELCSWLTKHCELLCALDCNCVTSDFINQLIQSDLDGVAYRKLLTILRVETFEIELSGIPMEKIEILIDLHYFSFTTSFFNELHQAYPELCMTYVFANICKHDIIVNELALNESHIEQLIISNQATSKLKLALLKKYGDQCMNHAIALHLVKTSIPIDISIFKAAWKLLNSQERFDLLMQYAELLDADDFEVCFSEIGGVFAPLADRSKRHDVPLEFCDRYILLADRLQVVDYITSYRIQEASKKNRLQRQQERQEIILRVKQVKDE
jgi:hypothetical protein